MQETQQEPQVHAPQGGLLPDFVHSVEAALEAGDAKAARELTLGLHEADLADLIELLHPEERSALITALGKDFNVATLSELDEAARDQVIEALPATDVARALRELDSDEAVYLLEDLEESEQQAILDKLPRAERAALKRSLEYPEDSAGRLMQIDYIAVPPFWSVGQTIDYMREDENLPDSFTEIYVVDPKHHVIGAVALNRLLRTKRPVKIEEITNKDVRIIPAHQDQEDVAREFERYDLVSAPVVDENQRMVGVVTADDIVEVIQEEAEEDIHLLGGVGAESIGDTVLHTTRGRFTWLLFNLATALLASMVIGLFEATIEQMVALAVLMPIVASMGGNAGTQTMTVAVRALATRSLGRVNALRVVTREAVVGLLNGLMFAAIMGAVAIYWFGNDTLGLVIAAAMIVNLLAAALAGILVPLGLAAFGLDPAIASTVFVTTVTDVVGFFAFLGMAAIWLV